MITIQKIEEELRYHLSNNEDHKRVLETNEGFLAFYTLCAVILHLNYVNHGDYQRALLLWQKEYRQLKRRLADSDAKLTAYKYQRYRKNIETIDPDSDEIKTEKYITHLKTSLEEKIALKPQIYPLPRLIDVMTFLSPADNEDLGDYFKKQAYYPHITSQEFLERKILDDDGNPILDEKGNPKHYGNPLKTVYGNYVTNLVPINGNLNEKATQKGLKKKFRCSNIDEVRTAIYEVGGVDFGEASFYYTTDIDDLFENPFRVLLVHPEIRLRFIAFANLDEYLRDQIGYYMILFASSLDARIAETIISTERRCRGWHMFQETPTRNLK